MIKDISHHLIFNKNCLNETGSRLQNDIFAVWQGTWKNLYAKQGNYHLPSSDDFSRYDILSALYLDQDLMGFSCHCFFDLNDNSVRQRNFMTMFTDSFIESLREKNIDLLMSYESLVVLPQFKHNSLNVSLGRLLLQLGNFFFHFTEADAIIATARNDNRVSEMTQSVGYLPIELNQACRGFHCDLNSLFRGSELKVRCPDLYSKAQRLWKNSTIHEGRPFLKPPSTSQMSQIQPFDEETNLRPSQVA